MRQGRDADALAAYRAAKDTFESLGEPGTVTTAWHQMGVVHRRARQFDEAERAYRQALAIKVQRRDRAGEANTLTELGTLSDNRGRLDEAGTFYRQAADSYVELQDMAREGRAEQRRKHTRPARPPRRGPPGTAANDRV
jgi:tetratricopeptide (TPR) repeat protein